MQPQTILLPLVSNPTGTLLVGAYIQDAPASESIPAFERLVERTLDISSMYATWSLRLGSWDRLRYVCSRQQLPLITWEPWGYPLARIAAGDYDALIDRELGALQATTCPRVIVRFAHEMNHRTVLWYDWQGQPEQYVAAWNHIVARARMIAPKVKWCWSPQTPADVYAYGFWEFYPGADTVDLVGTTITNFVSADPNYPYRTNWQWFHDRWRVEYPYYHATGKPILLAEVATTERPGDPTAKGRWISDMVATARATPEVMGVVWLNTNYARIEPDNPYRVNTSEASLAAFRAAIQP